MSEPQYETKGGLKAEILTRKLHKNNHPIMVIITGDNGREDINTYTTGLKYFESGDNDKMDLVLVTEWDDFKVDDPVMVRIKGCNWIKSHFKEVNGYGKPTSFQDGSTSWTSRGYFMSDECRRPTKEEIGEGQ